LNNLRVAQIPPILEWPPEEFVSAHTPPSTSLLLGCEGDDGTHLAVLALLPLRVSRAEGQQRVSSTKHPGCRPQSGSLYPAGQDSTGI